MQKKKRYLASTRNTSSSAACVGAQIFVVLREFLE